MRLFDRPPNPLLVAAFIVGLILRFLNLTGKPLWMDEVITSIFSLGQTYDAIPTGQTLTVSELTQFLTFNTNATCQDITRNVATQSVHPPVFFCAMHYWLGLFKQTAFPLVWQLRSFSAFLGIATIGLAYAIGKRAFNSRNIGIASAWVMAVSPFAIYLSQEARHYTLPMTIVMLGLLALITIQQDWQQGQINPLVWVGWAACQTVGLYTHYFCLMSTVGQIGALVLWQWWQHPSKQRFRAMSWVPVAFTVSAIGFTYAPWIATLVSHITRPETNWMKSFNPNIWTFLAPLWQLPIGWLSMIASFPVENQPIWVIIPMAILTIGLGVWIFQQTFHGLQALWRNATTRGSVMILSTFLSIVLVEFLGIIFVLGKDISQVPRYNFIYYPVVGLLLSAGLYQRSSNKVISLKHQPLLLLIIVGIISGIFINSNLAFQKSFRPGQVASNITLNNSTTATVVMGYQDYQEQALGLSFVLALKQIQPDTRFLFLDRRKGYGPIIDIFPKLPSSDQFWFIAPGFRQANYPNQIQIGNRQCGRRTDQYHRIGIPYQGYECK